MKKSSKLKTFFRFFKVMISSRPQLLFLYFVAIINNLVTTLVGIYGTSLIVRAVEEGDTPKAVITAIAVVAALFVSSVLAKTEQRLSLIESKEVESLFTILLAQKFERLPYEILEDPLYLDKKESGLFAINNQGIVLQIISLSETILGNLTTMVSSLVIIMLFDDWLLLIAAVGAFLFVVIMFLSSSFLMKLDNELIPVNRKFGYFTDTMFDSSYGKDFRLYPLGETAARKTINFNASTKPFLYRIFFTSSITSAFGEIVSFLVGAASMILVGLRVIRDKLSLSVYSLYCGATLNLVGVAQFFVTSFGQLYMATSFIEPLIEFLYMDEDEAGSKTWDEEVKTVEFQHVYFSYPRQKEEVLHDVSFKIAAGEKISLIGLNGVGKTTTIKILCGLYKPSKGKVLINGHDIQEYTFGSRARLFSTVFQDFKLFPLTIKENVMGRNGDETAYERVMEESGSSDVVKKLKYGDQSVFGKNFSEKGVDLSGGESQKLAIARAVLKKSSIVVLDEPTSALDPVAESEIYENFNNMVKGKTAIFISHRMSSCVFSDKVLVLDYGRLLSFAPHKELLKDKDSLYYKMFMAQAKNYKLKKSIS